VKIKKAIPVCALFVSFHGPHGTVDPKGRVTAASQISQVGGVHATDIYINTNTRALSTLTQATILHEVLHNITGLYDFVPLNLRTAYGYQSPYDLKTFVGVELYPGVDPDPTTTNAITVQLRSKGCAGSN
jgi:hypothetical protein